jgi:hypothetical protein
MIFRDLLKRTFERLRVGMSRCGSRRFSAAVATRLARSTIRPRVLASTGGSFALAVAGAAGFFARLVVAIEKHRNGEGWESV